MDVESFYQCLGYVQLIQEKSDDGWGAQWLPSLLGVVLGFLLSLLAMIGGSFIKSRRQKKAILAEVSVIKQQAARTFVAAVDLVFSMRVNPRSQFVFRPAATISTPLFDQCYSNVAHSYSVAMVEQFQYIPAHVRAVNCLAAELLVKREGRDPAALVKLGFELIGDAARLYCTCESIELGVASSEPLISEVLAKNLGVDQPIIDIVFRARNESD